MASVTSSLRRALRKKAVPSASGDSVVLDIAKPSSQTPQPPLFERPASHPLNKSGIRSRVSISGKVQKLRNISPRMKELYEAVEKNCKEWLGLGCGRSDKKMKEIAEYNITTQDRIGEKLWDDNYGPEGLVQVLHDNVNLMRELRMIIEYGDYLALGLERMCQQDMDDLIWRISTVNWKGVWENIRREQRSLDSYYSAPQTIDSKPPTTPFLKDTTVAANRTSINEDLILFEIEMYASRNELCHSDLKILINKCNWADLAKRILTDLESVKEVFRLHPDKGQRMKEAIETQKDRWFVYAKRVGGEDDSTIYETTNEAKKKQEALRRRIFSDTI